MNALLVLARASSAMPSGEELIPQLLHFLGIALIVLLIWAIGYYFIRKGPGWLMWAWNGLFILLGGLVLVKFLMELFGV